MAEYLCEEDMSTGEYISRDVALRQLNATCLATACNNYNGVMCRACAYADAMDFIDAIPAADVQPVKRGRWLTWDDSGLTKCSYCNSEYYIADLQEVGDSEGFVEFCPNCGASMGGGVKNE